MTTESEMSDGNTTPLGKSQKRAQYLGALAACLFGMNAGTAIGWSSAASSLRDGFAGYTIEQEQWSWVVAMMPAGAVLSSLPTGSAVQALGRRNFMLLLSPMALLGWACIVLTPQSIWALMLGRFISGVTIGSYSIVAPMFTAEISEDTVRGVVGSYFQLMVCIGVMFVYILGWAMDDPLWISGICAISPVLGALAFFFFKDTPNWYLSREREVQAKDALRFYRGPNFDVDAEMLRIKAVLKEQRERQVPFRQAIVSKAAKKALLHSLVLMILQKMCGVFAITFYASDLFKSGGTVLPKGVPEVIVGTFLAGATGAAPYLLKKFGRRTLLFFSGAVSAICNAIIGVYLYLQAQEDISETFGWILTTAMSLLMVSFSFGYGPIPYLYMSEVFSPQLKGVGMAMANISNWLTVFIIGKFYGVVSDAIGVHTTFWAFAGSLVLGCIFTHTLLLETKDKSKEQILAELAGEEYRPQC